MKQASHDSHTQGRNKAQEKTSALLVEGPSTSSRREEQNPISPSSQFDIYKQQSRGN